MVTRIVNISDTGVHLPLWFQWRPCQLLWHPTLLLALTMAACATAQKYNVDVRPWPSGLPYTGLVTLHMESDRRSEMYRALCESVGMRLDVRHLEIRNRVVGVALLQTTERAPRVLFGSPV